MQKETYWSRFANDFEERNNYVAGKNNVEAICTALKKQAAAGQVLELGCGNGTYSKVLSETAEKVLATDFSDEMLTASKERLQDFDNIMIEKQDCMNLAYSDGKFDFVVMINLLHIIPDPQKALNESKRVLKDRGSLIVISLTMEGLSFFNKLGMIYRYIKTYGKPPKTSRKLTVTNTKTLLESNGFIAEETYLIGSTSKAVFARAIRKPEK